MVGEGEEKRCKGTCLVVPEVFMIENVHALFFCGFPLLAISSLNADISLGLAVQFVSFHFSLPRTSAYILTQ